MVSSKPLWRIQHASHWVRAGGVIAYPTETVWGLGCDPFCQTAVDRILAVKQRAPEKGFIIIASEINQLRLLTSTLSSENIQKLTSQPRPTTWIMRAHERVPSWVTGGRATIAVRLTQDPFCQQLCNSVGAIISTSANRSGKDPASSRWDCIRQFYHEVDWVVPGETPENSKPSRIIDMQTGAIIRE
ncbi:L-threonylcarbamoyladenylate synthase [Pleionea sediminis]|uniref:L-threonylcarbamoyladenylate synthase n=1 Tax=Pleionea sediminis TaxID=2569479 RepID=UPI001184F5E5|nr:L-threonylcarbamoyladenylate synthase [Pleionea sediminis]